MSGRFKQLDVQKLNDAYRAAYLTFGDVWYVKSTTGDDGRGGAGESPETPFATIDYAVGRASRGDIIVPMSGHTEAVATDGGLTIDTDGIFIVGQGYGDGRPLIQIGTAAAAAVILSADGCLIDNVRFSIAIDAATDPIQITGDGNVMRNFEIIEASACESLDLLSIGADANRNVLHDFVIRGRNTTDGDALNAIHLNGCDDCEIYNGRIFGGDWSQGVIFNEGDETLNLYIHNMLLETKAPEDLCVVMDTNATGWIHDIKCVLHDDAANIDECLSIGHMYAYDPLLVVNAVSEKGIEWAGTDSVDSA